MECEGRSVEGEKEMMVQVVRTKDTEKGKSERNTEGKREENKTWEEGAGEKAK